MSYQVLARKWRPKTFQELMGQLHVVTVLTNALQQQRLHHAYLFTGTRGVGKTTIARIFAKSLNCLQGITADPCGQCDACIDIDKGRFVDLLEIDAASRTKVDDTREILDNVQYAPSRGRYKVYLIDEVHMLSRSSFNALLKTLEEPPEHVKFILATTDPQKLPVTVLSRCLQFHLKALSVPQIDQQLRIILDAEKVTYEDTAILLLAKAARGSMRDSLSLTDQAIAQGNGNIIAKNVQEMLGGVDHNWVFRILIALIKQDANSLMNVSLEIASFAPNYGRLLAELLQLLHQIAMNQVVEKHFDLSPEHNQLLEKFCVAMSPEDVQLYYQIVLNGRKDLPYAADEQAAFDMIILRLLAFKPVQLGKANEEVVDTSNHINFDEDLTELKEKSIRNGVKQEPILDSQISQAEPANSHEIEFIDNANDKTQELAQELEAIEAQAELANLASKTMDVDEPHFPKIPNLQNQSHSTNQSEQITDTAQQSKISSIIESRNMLRSRKKALENNGKKSKDAEERQKDQVLPVVIGQLENLPDIEMISQQPFVPENIDPSIVKKANQVDKWANMIDSMALNGRLRQLALNATIDESSDENVFILLLHQSTKHLKSDVAHQQLEQFVSNYCDKKMIVDIRIVESTIDDPRQIQNHIDVKRLAYAKELLLSDELVIALQNNFQATLDENSVEAR